LVTRLTTVADVQAFAQRAWPLPVLAVYLEYGGPDPLQHTVTRWTLATEEEVVQLNTADFSGAEKVAALLSPLLTGRSRVKAFHDAKKALRYLLRLQLYPERLFDSMLADQLLSAGGLLSEPKLVETAARHLDASFSSLKEEPPPAVAATLIYNLRKALVPQLVQAGLVRCAELEFECTLATAEIENNGLRLDTARLRELTARGAQKMAAAAQAFALAFGLESPHLFGTDFTSGVNLNSDSQLLSFLQKQGLPLRRVSAKALQPFLSQYPVLQHILDYRQGAVEYRLESFLSAVSPVTGRLHPTYSQLAAATGRFSCSNPNIQSFPRAREYRACIIPAPGKLFAIADYSQIELRIAAQICKDQRMLEAFRSGQDLHRLTAGILMDKPPETVTPKERQAAKAVNFGLIYAMGAAGLAAYATQQYGVEMTLEEATRFRERYFQAYRGVAAWHARAKREQPTMVRSLSGRLRRVPKGALTNVLNSPVQGTGADILKKALLLLSRALRPLGGQIVAMIHDEILVETTAIQAEVVARVMSRAMEEAAAAFLPDVPCPVSVTLARSWAEKE